MRQCVSCVVVGAAVAALAGTTHAAPISYSVAGSQYVEHFDTLQNTTENNVASDFANDTEVPGWLAIYSIATSNTTTTNMRKGVGHGNNTGGGFWSYGTAAGSTDRAFGYLGANTTGTGDWGTRFSNDTGQSIDKFTLSYTAEQWHRESDDAQRVDFQYSTNATSINDGAATWTTVEALSVTDFPQKGALLALDGNAAANQIVYSNVVVDIPDLAPGGLLWIRWNDINDTTTSQAGRDNSMGVDDLTFSATVTPEPAALSLLALMGLGMARRRRI